MNILVVGGAGYIGSTVAQLLVEAGLNVFVFDDLSKGHRQAIPAQAQFIHGDLASLDDINMAMDASRADAVFHFAALIEAGESMQKPAPYFRANVANTINLLEACATHQVGRIVFSSTAAVFAASDTPLTEKSAVQPANCYGETKLMVEQMLQWFNTVYGLRYVVLRYFNACGAYGDRGEAHLPETHLIPLILKAALGQRKQVNIYGSDYPTPDGTCIRDYIHIYDLAAAHLLALKYLDTHDKLICNLGSGTGYSVREVIDMARKVSGKPFEVRETERRPGDAARLVASSDLAKAELGWQPRYTSLEEIVASAWDWMSRHPHGYADGK
ncbi:MAG TPA: UDP-glucose 4-epimerase GalE [Anaerolineae bacterium]